MTDLQEKAMRMALDVLGDVETSGWTTKAAAREVMQALRQALDATKFLPEEMDAYEQGFIEGRQDQMRFTVERAVNAMTKREWQGLTDSEVMTFMKRYPDTLCWPAAKAIEAKLKEKNT